MFIHDSIGRLIPPARVDKRLRWDVWNDSALPSWLTAPVGTVTFSTVGSGGRGLCRVTSGAVAGDAAELAANFTIDLAVVNAVMWTVEGWQFDAASGTTAVSGFDAELSMLGTAGIGCAYRQLRLDTYASLLAQGTTSAEVGTYDLLAGGRRNLTLAASNTSGQVVALQDDQDVQSRLLTSIGAGAVTPRVKITAQTGGAHFMEFAAVELRVFHN